MKLTKQQQEALNRAIAGGYISPERAAQVFSAPNKATAPVPTTPKAAAGVSLDVSRMTPAQRTAYAKAVSGGYIAPPVDSMSSYERAQYENKLLKDGITPEKKTTTREQLAEFGGMPTAPERPKAPSLEHDPHRDADRARRRVEQQGEDFTPDRKKPTWWDHLFGKLDAVTGAAATRAFVANINKGIREGELYKALDGASYTDDGYRDLGDETKRAWSGQDTTTEPEQLLTELTGWEEDPDAGWGERTGRGASVLALAMASDPTTWATGGLSALTKSKYTTNLANAAKRGVFSADDAARLGKYSSKIGKYAGEHFDDIGKRGQREIAAAFKREARDAAGEGILHLKKSNLLNRPEATNIIGGLGANSPVSILQDNVFIPAISALDDTYVGKAATDVAGRVSNRVKNARNMGKLTGAAFDAAEQSKRKAERAMTVVGNEAADFMQRTARKAKLGDDVLEAVPYAIGDYARETGSIAKSRAANAAKKAAAEARDALRNLSPDAPAAEREAAKKAVRKAMHVLKETTAEAAAVNTRDAATIDKIVDHLEAVTKTAYDEPQRKAIHSIIDKFTETMERAAKSDPVSDIGIGYVPGISDKMDDAAKAAYETFTGKPLEITYGLGETSSEMGNQAGDAGVKLGQKVYDHIAERLGEGISSVTSAPDLTARRLAQSGASAAREAFDDAVVAMGRNLGNASDTSLEAAQRAAKAAGGNPRNVKAIGGRFVEIAPEIMREYAKYDEVLKSKPTLDRVSKIADWMSNQFRKWALSTPGFVSRNVQSNLINLFANNAADGDTLKQGLRIAYANTLGDIDKAAEYLAKNADDVAKGSGKVVRNADEWRNVIREMKELGILDSGRALDVDFSDRLFRGFGWSDGVSKANSIAEGQARATAYLTGLKRGLTPEAAANFTERIMYDYDPRSLTSSEQAVRKIVPFYTWIRRNLPAQVSLLINDPSKISIYDKLKDAGAATVVDDTDETTMPEYVRDMSTIPISLPSGETIHFNPNFSFQDLQRLDSFLKPIVEGGSHESIMDAAYEFIEPITPVLKVPIEIVLNYDAFYKDNIADYKGQKKRAHPVIEDLIRISGIDVPDDWVDKKTGNLIYPPQYEKLVQMHPLIGNLLRWTDTRDAADKNSELRWTTSPKQRSRLFSSLFGLKSYRDDPEGWAKSAAYSDKRDLNEIIKRLQDIGSFNTEADEALSAVFSDETEAEKRKLLEATPEWKQYEKDRVLDKDLERIARARRNAAKGRKVDWAEVLRKLEEGREHQELSFENDALRRALREQENRRRAEELRVRK